MVTKALSIETFQVWPCDVNARELSVGDRFYATPYLDNSTKLTLIGEVEAGESDSLVYKIVDYQDSQDVINVMPECYFHAEFEFDAYTHISIIKPLMYRCTPLSRGYADIEMDIYEKDQGERWAIGRIDASYMLIAFKKPDMTKNKWVFYRKYNGNMKLTIEELMNKAISDKQRRGYSLLNRTSRRTVEDLLLNY